MIYDRYLKVHKGLMVFYFPKDLPIAFDWDETLIDTREQFEHSMRRSLDVYGHEHNYGEFEEEVTGTIPKWVYTLFELLGELTVHIISNKPNHILMKELSSTPFLKNIASITGDARKPDNSEVFHKIGPAGVMFGDSMRNDLIGAIKAGWEYQFLCVNHSPDDSDVVIVTECVVEGV